MRAARWSPIAVAVVLLTGCAQSHTQADRSTLHLTARDNHRELTLARREEFVVTLPSNPSTGYRWEGTSGSTPNDVGARLLFHRYVGPKQAPPGAEGKEIWRFRAVGRGALPLGFAYVLPWDFRQRKPARFVGFTIVVS